MALSRKFCTTQQELVSRRMQLQTPVVFTNGVFDIVHRGHVAYLEEARALGGSLIVALNSDASVRTLGKGDDRPLNSLADRMAVIAALESVSLVVAFSESTPINLLRELRPNIYVKGGDYDMENLEEATLVRGWGGEAKALQFVTARSTTALLRRIRGE